MDDEINRVLSGAFTKFDEPKMTMELCREKCDGFAYFGLENSNQCFCGQKFRLPLEMVSESECDMECPGNTDESCGAFLRMNIWSQHDDKPPATWTGQCVQDNPTSPILNGPSFTIPENSPSACKSKCDEQGYTFYGLEDGTKCFCGTEVTGAVKTFGCTTPCPGNENESRLPRCGGPDYKMNLYG